MFAFLVLAGCSGPDAPTEVPSVPTPPPPTPTDTASDTGAPVDTAVEPPPPPPTPPPNLVRYVTGAEPDFDVQPLGPGLILMGGGAEPDAAFQWWRPLVAGGDVVVIRTSGSDGYNDYLYADIGGVDSVETLLVDTVVKANHPYVLWRLQTAEGIFMAGGDQADYLDSWRGTGVQQGLHDAWDRGAVIGGTSAGLAVLGDRVFSASNGTVYTDEALDDPYNLYMTFEDGFLDIPMLDGLVTDTHFAERDRMGRLVGFVARAIEDGLATEFVGIGVDERTAVVVGPDGEGRVVGDGSVYTVHMDAPAATCTAGQPLVVSGVTRRRLDAGDTVSFPGAISTGAAVELSASGGDLSPSDPY